MKTKPDPINLPYSSTVASYFGDQGPPAGNSFLGRLFQGRTGQTVVNAGARPTGATSATSSGRSPLYKVAPAPGDKERP